MTVLAHPVVLVSPAPIPSRNVMVWDDQAAQDAMRVGFEKQGWTWLTLLLREQTPALILMPPPPVTDEQISEVIADVNAGKYGKLNGGYGQIGAPQTQGGSTKS